MEKFKEDQLKEKTINSEIAYDGKYLRLYKDDVELFNGHVTYREYLRHPGAVCILAINNQKQIVLERQYRYPFNKIFYEVPAGKLNTTDEDHLLAAQRELKEETGIIARKWCYLGQFCPTIAYSDEVIHMYLAQDLIQEERELDEDELLNVQMVDLKEAVQMVMNNVICDGKSQTIILKVNQLLKYQDL